MARQYTKKRSITNQGAGLILAGMGPKIAEGTQIPGMTLGFVASHRETKVASPFKFFSTRCDNIVTHSESLGISHISLYHGGPQSKHEGKPFSVKACPDSLPSTPCLSSAVENTLNRTHRPASHPSTPVRCTTS